MRGLKAWACAVVFAASAAPATAQLTGGTSGAGSNGSTNTSGGTRTTTGTGGVSSGTTAGSSTTSTSSSSGSSSPGTADSLATSGLETLQQQNLQFSNIGVTSTSNLQKSNVFASFYANPYSMGVSSTSGAGGFGKPLFTATSTSSNTGRTGTTGTGRTGLNSSSTQSGILIPLRVQMNYAAELRFPTSAVAPPRLQADLRSAIDAGGLASPGSVQVIADANNNVVLRGTVKDDEEKRLVEGLVRLTPGVGNITNDLSYPVASK